MKKYLSYLWPDTKRFWSDINGTLEVTYINGKKVLDTENANYSYGSLQKILEFGLTKVDLQEVENILLLGMGGGSIIDSLRETFDYKKNMVAVDLDPKVIEIAQDEFGISASENLQIVQADALAYVKECQEKFQLIIIDLFIDLSVPPVFYEKEFCKNVAALLQKNGSIIFNLGVHLKKESDLDKTIISNFGEDYEFRTFPKVNGTNTLLIGERTGG